MAKKIRGMQWQLNYRGFDVYYVPRNNQYRMIPDENLINKDLATVQHCAGADTMDEALSMINDHFEILASL